MTDAERKVLRIIINMFTLHDRKPTFEDLSIKTGKQLNELIIVLKSLEDIGKIEIDYEKRLAMLPEEYHYEKRARLDREVEDQNRRG
ncbi:hypothetical protein FLK61_26300 [Paenalkalicoccus suaedae]|uniref:MarR family transcriptional regulator n=1 Tax=Paenalkalicoccus suaedae TaxID=2592382 RepID=A0A859FDE7_9BACI|nr:hypothetical protein [Paenalkalicoccus suaedae]QKS70275.1 hypothetical protein FLK61_26300 [Paenalkalicoccus suaedae]